MGLGLGLVLGLGVGLGVRVRRWDWAKWGRTFRTQFQVGEYVAHDSGLYTFSK